MRMCCVWNLPKWVPCASPQSLTRCAGVPAAVALSPPAVIVHLPRDLRPSRSPRPPLPPPLSPIHTMASAPSQESTASLQHHERSKRDEQERSLRYDELRATQALLPASLGGLGVSLHSSSSFLSFPSFRGRAVLCVRVGAMHRATVPHTPLMSPAHLSFTLYFLAFSH